MLVEEMEEYWDLLRQLESMTEEESDDSFEGMPCLVQYFWCDMWSTLVLVFFY